MDMKEEAKTAQRLRKGASETPRKVMAFRVNADLYEKLQKSSHEKGLSLTEEIEKRLEQSFREAADPIDEAAVQMIIDSWRAIRNITKKDWYSDHYALTASCESMVTTMKILAKVSMGAKGVDFAQFYKSTNAALFGRTYAEAIAMKRAGISTPETETKLLDILEDVETKRRHAEALAAALAAKPADQPDTAASPDPVAQFAQDPTITAADVREPDDGTLEPIPTEAKSEV